MTTAWTGDHVDRAVLRPEVAAPPIDGDFPVMSDEVWLWDSWPLTDLRMRPVSVAGWHVLFGLVAPRGIPFDDRHAVARIGWFASRDGRSWEYRGLAIPEGTGLGTRQWSGSAVLVDGTAHLFYTACGEGGADGSTAPGWDRTDHVQRAAHATASVRATAERIAFGSAGFSDSEAVAEGDGSTYQSAEQARDSEILYGFRDPFVFADDGAVHMMFTANLPGPGCFTACVGLARARDASLASWELLPPLLHARGVNQQLERPHLVRDQGRYYLFFLSHQETYAPGHAGPDGLYGFVGERLRGPFRPVNGDALVVVSEPARPPERYADYVMPNWLVEGFVDAVEGRRGGTLAPTLRLAADGDQVRIAGALGYGEIPVMADVPAAADSAGQ